ncbi:hypothetical protein [Celeribacter sp.]|uniref:hypothetical protein n=1 Tax=Celeribacter sp. TaxID=1890673 RepID=UPI003A91A7D4
MTRRILIHPGFHKTGTTTLQETLRVNRALLTPHVEMYIAGDLTQALLAGATIEFSADRRKQTRDIIAEEAEALFDSFEPDDPRPILMSNESLSGHGIGHKGVHRYAATAPAMKVIHDAWRRVMGPEAPFEIYISTRQKGWLASCYWQRLKKKRFRMALDEFEEKFASAADHAAIIKATRNMLPDVPVTSCDVADAGHPVRPVLDLLGLGELFDDLTLPANENTYPGGDARDRLLALNRSDLFGPEYWVLKTAIINGENTSDLPLGDQFDLRDDHE